MQGFNNKPTMAGRIVKSRTILASIIVVLVGGAGFAATGGAEVVRNLLIEVKMIGPDGTVFNGTLQPVDGDDSTFQLETPDGGNATVILNRADPEMIQVQVTKTGAEAGFVATADGAGVQPAPLNSDAPARLTVTTALSPEEAEAALAGLGQDSNRPMLILGQPGAIAAMPSVVDAIDDPEEIFQWEDADGATREVSVVRDGDQAYRIYSTLDDGRYAQIGTAMTNTSFELGDLVFDDEGKPTLTFYGPNGSEMNIAINPITSLDQRTDAPARKIILQRPSSTPRE